MRKILAALATMAAVVVGGLAITASPAAAVQACPIYGICFYDTASVGALRIEYRDGGDTSAGECHVMPPSANNKASYVINRTDRPWRIYNATNCTGAYGLIYAGSGGGIPTFNNITSSYKQY